MRPNLIKIMKHGNHSSARLVPVQYHAQQILRGALVHGGEGLVEQDHRCVLQQQARKKGALEFAHGQVFDGWIQ